MHNFRDIDEFVCYLDTQAKTARHNQKRFHPRSHDHAYNKAVANTFEQIATLVRTSNLVAITDFAAAATVVKR